MKNKKLLLPVIFLVSAIVLTSIYAVIMSIAKKPTVTEAEFPFSITYELDGKTETIKDVYKVRYKGNDGKARIYVGEIGDMGEDNTYYILKKGKNTRVELNTFFYSDYMIGDTEYDYFDEEPFEPKILYYDSQEVEYTDPETLAAQGVKLMSFEYPKPIKNSFVFSHIAHLDNGIVFPAILFALLALIATLIFVKKEKDYVRKPIDIVSIVFHCIIGSVFMIYATVIAVLIDLAGDNESILVQIFYFIPTLTILGITSSIALRRKGYSVIGFISQFIGPAVFAVILAICGVLELL